MPDSPPNANLLPHETSPYLLQHAENPVHWRAWGPAALADAARLRRPILLSVGYAACHWCHVMAHESFEDPETAALMNARFVNIKVDREERPDIDAIYQQALAMLGEQGGWPLTMFLTPEGQPFWGGTYFPREPLYGRPGFRDVLSAIADTYDRAPERIAKNVDALNAGFETLSHPAGGDTPSPAETNAYARQLLDLVDWTHGGVGAGAPKFPQPTLLTRLWTAGRRGADPRCREAVLLSLRRMGQGGIYDHLGGGFARYATDRQWLVPHFEKMLYDNALLLPLLALAHRATGETLFRRRAEETAAWLLADMHTPDGGFASARDADSEGGEGAYYVWTAEEIDAVLDAAGLSADADLFKRTYDVTPAGNWEGRTILNRLSLEETDARPTAAEEQRLDRARGALLAARDRRPAPMKDDKVLADWNGLAIAGLARAGMTLGRPDWIAAAARAFDFVAERMVDRDRGPDRLLHSFRAGAARHAGMLDDHVFMADGALALHQATGESRYLERADAWMASLHAHFHDDRPVDQGGGGYFLTADDAEELVTRTKTAGDSATPAGNGVAVQVLADLHLLTGAAAPAARADAIVRRFAGDLPRAHAGYASLIDGALRRAEGRQLVIVGPGKDRATAALLDTARREALDPMVIQAIDPTETLPANHPAAGKGLVDGRPAAYLCQGPVCAPPITDPDRLAEQLAGRLAEAGGGPVG